MEQKQTIEERFLAILQGSLDALESGQRFRGLLKDFFPGEPATVNLLSTLHSKGIHTEIGKSDRVTGDLAYRFTKQLIDEHGTDSRRAGEAVRLFCVCYGGEILGKPCDMANTDGRDAMDGDAGAVQGGPGGIGTQSQPFLAMLQGSPDALESGQRFRGLLNDFFPGEPATVNLLSILHSKGIHTEIGKSDRVTRDLAYRFTKRLIDEHGTDSRRAGEAVRLFCVCYGGEILGKPCDMANTDGRDAMDGDAGALQGEPERNRITQEQEEKQRQIEPGLSKERCKNRRLELARYCTSIAVGGEHTAGLRADGTVVAVGRNVSGQCDTGGWRDIVAIAGGGAATVGLRADGTVAVIGSNTGGRCNTDGWRDVVAIAEGVFHTVGLRADGTVVAVGENDSGECNTGGWRDVVTIAACNCHNIASTGYTVGIRADGTVVATGDNGDGRCDTGGWRDIVAIAGGYRCTVGLRADGTVVAVGRNSCGQCDTGDWRDIVAIAGGFRCTVGLRADGSVAAAGMYGQDIGDWEDIVAVAVGYGYTAGLRADGTVVATGNNEHGQCNTGGWRDVVAIAAGTAITVGLRSDGTVVAAGNNESGQCNTGGWRNIGMSAETKWRMQGLCVHCGGQFGGLFTKKCKACGMAQ